MSAKLGASTSEIQQIGAVAKLTGGDFGQMALQLERMQLGLAKSQSASSPARAALAALGIEAEHFRSLPIPQQLETLAEAFARFADGPAKTAAAMALLGRAGADMIPYLDRGKEGIRDLADEASAAGGVLSAQMVAALAKTREDLSLLGVPSAARRHDSWRSSTSLSTGRSRGLHSSSPPLTRPQSPAASGSSRTNQSTSPSPPPISPSRQRTPCRVWARPSSWSQRASRSFRPISRRSTRPTSTKPGA